MELKWMERHRSMVEKIIKYGNAYANTYKLQRDYETGILFSASQIQTLEYILESEDKDEKMSEMANRLGVSRSTFSKNVKILMEKGLLEKFRCNDNRKDIYVKASQKGREIYEKYTEFVYRECFEEMFRLADQVSPKDLKTFENILDCLSETLIWYGEDERKPHIFTKI